MTYPETEEYGSEKAINETFSRIHRQQVDRYNNKLQTSKGITLFIAIFMIVLNFLISMAMFKANMPGMGIAVIAIGLACVTAHVFFNVIPRIKEKPRDYNE